MVENIINDKIQNKISAGVGENQINNIVQGAYLTKSNKFVTAKYKSNIAENKIMALAMTRLRVEHEHVVATIEAREAMAILVPYRSKATSAVHHTPPSGFLPCSAHSVYY